jgi:hypothetical protein
MTWIDFVRIYEPAISDEMAGCILWSETAFPFSSIQHTTYQIRSAIRAINNDVKRCDLCGMKKGFCRKGCLNYKGGDR